MDRGSLLTILSCVLLASCVQAQDWFGSGIWDWGAGGHSHDMPPHVAIPPQKSVCDKLVYWLDMLGHNNTYYCKPLPSDIHGVVHEFCNIAGVETFNNCKEEKKQLVIEDCLGGSLEAVESSVLFNSCLCHGYLENYAGMWAVWKMICERDPVPYHSHGYPHYPYYPGDQYHYGHPGEAFQYYHKKK